MIAFIIRWSIANRLLVLIATLMISAWGVVSVYKTPLDALPESTSPATRRRVRQWQDGGPFGGAW